MDNFETNNNLFKYQGIINRRNFIVNILTVEILIQAIVATPLIFATFLNNDLLLKVYANSAMPKWWNLTIFISSILSSILYMPSIIKRLRDIYGDENKEKITPYALFTFIIMILGGFTAMSSNIIFAFIRFFGMGILISLMCMKGKISGSEPKNEVLKFNWGAFLATWIWGLFNKSYKTLWAIPLMFTSGFFPFAIVCGIKGNEWAYKKAKDKTLEKFHNSQRKQTILWCLLMPVIIFIMGFIMLIFSAAMFKSYTDSHPEFGYRMTEFYIQTVVKTTEENFDKIELKNNEYKFYINPKTWVKASPKNRNILFESAGYYALTKTGSKEDAVKNAGSVPVSTLNKVKIYSTFNDEVLAQFYMSKEDESKIIDKYKSDPKSKTLISKEIIKYYKINSYPTLP